MYARGKKHLCIECLIEVLFLFIHALLLTRIQ